MNSRVKAIFIPLFHFNSFMNIQTIICSFKLEMNWPLFLITVHSVARPLLDGIYPPLEINIWWNVNFISVVDFISDLIAAISQRQAVDLNSPQLSSYKPTILSKAMYHEILLQTKWLIRSDNLPCYSLFLWMLYTLVNLNKFFFPLEIYIWKLWLFKLISVF